MFWDRRKGDRRADKAKPDAPGTERRTDSGAKDRRHWTSGVLYKTSLPVTEIESWLDKHAKGKWAVGLEGIDDGLHAKVLKIMFENPDDKTLFVTAFARRR